MAHFAFQVLCEVRKPLENEQTKWNKILCKLICSLLEKGAFYGTGLTDVCFKQLFYK